MSRHYDNNEKRATIVWGRGSVSMDDGLASNVSVCQSFEFEEEFLELLGREPAVQGTPMCHGDGPCLLRYDDGKGIALLRYAQGGTVT